MNFKATLLASTVALLAAGAQASTFDFGVHNVPIEMSAAFSGAGGVAPGTINDVYTFELPGAVNVSSTVVANNNGSVLSITGGGYAIFSVGGDGAVGGGDDVMKTSLFSFDGTTGSTTHTVALASGKYFYAIGGNSTGSVGGFYSLSSVVSAVPEPETLAMLLAGLGVVGFVANRRKSV